MADGGQPFVQIAILTIDENPASMLQIVENIVKYSDVSIIRVGI